MATIDLRSDTVTRPTAGMRGDSRDRGQRRRVDDDPRCTAPGPDHALFGTEAALFVPTGTMANQIALRAHTQPGDEVILGKDAHCWRSEAGALAALSGLQTNITADYTFTAAEVRAAFRSGDDPHLSLTRVVTVENTHNAAGGTCWDPRRSPGDRRAPLAWRPTSTARGSGTPRSRRVRARARPASTRSARVCQGARAPIGSLIAGRRDFIKRCRKLRKMLGGGCARPACSPPGLYALDHHRARLATTTPARARWPSARRARTSRRPGARPDQHRDDRARPRQPRGGEPKAREAGVLIGRRPPRLARSPTSTSIAPACCGRRGHRGHHRGAVTRPAGDRAGGRRRARARPPGARRGRRREGPACSAQATLSELAPPTSAPTPATSTARSPRTARRRQVQRAAAGAPGPGGVRRGAARGAGARARRPHPGGDPDLPRDPGARRRRRHHRRDRAASRRASCWPITRSRRRGPALWRVVTDYPDEPIAGDALRVLVTDGRRRDPARCPTSSPGC
jgi:threonine aldolase